MSSSALRFSHRHGAGIRLQINLNAVLEIAESEPACSIGNVDCKIEIIAQGLRHRSPPDWSQNGIVDYLLVASWRLHQTLNHQGVFANCRSLGPCLHSRSGCARVASLRHDLQRLERPQGAKLRVCQHAPGFHRAQRRQDASVEHQLTASNKSSSEVRAESSRTSRPSRANSLPDMRTTHLSLSSVTS